MRMHATRWIAVMLLLAGTECTEQQPPAKTEAPRVSPSSAPVSATRPEVPVQKPSTQPATRPATKPAASLPESTFSSSPPYPVELHVATPDEPQPGWLRVMQLANKNAPATVKGIFPEQNRMIVETQNVDRLELHLGYLPINESKRISLRIDKQGMEILRGKDKRYIVLQRRPTGEWVVEKTPSR